MMKPIAERRRAGGNATPATDDQVPGKGQAGQAQGDAEEWGEPATDDEQSQYERLVLAGSQILFSPETSPKIVKMMQTMADKPDQALAAVAVLIVTQLDEQSGGQIPEELILPPVAEFIEQAAELASNAKVFEVDEAVMNRAAQIAIEKLADQYGVSQEQIQALMSQVPPDVATKYRDQQQGYLQGGGRE